MHNVIYFDDRGCVRIYERWHRDIFLILYFFRLHYTMQLGMENVMLWRFSCAMEPTSMKKMYEMTEMRSGGGDGKTDRQNEQL